VSKYGLPLGVVAGLLLAAALGAVAGARWAGKRARLAGDGQGLAGDTETSAADRQDPRRASVPRFLTSGVDDPSEEASGTARVAKREAE